MFSAPVSTGTNCPIATPASSTQFSDEAPADTHLLFLDNDVFVLLAGSGLLAEVIASLQFSYSRCRCLASLRPMLAKGTFSDTLSPLAVDRALSACDLIPAIDDRTPSTASDLYDELLAVEQIDPGEAQLIVRVLQGRHWLASGDKRWMKALSREPSLAHVHQSLGGRVLCLESLLELLFGRGGRERLSNAFAHVHATHTTLRVILGAQDDRNFREALYYHLTELETHVGAGFLWRPEPT
jgi:hypothetical protein